MPVTIGRRRPETAEDRKQAAERERNRIASAAPASLVGPAPTGQAQRAAELPAAVRSTVLHGVVRTAVYQSPEYADQYLDRVCRAVADVDPDRDGDAALTCQAARHIALWMCYQDTIQVAAQKTRRGRMDRVRKEAKAGEGQLMQVREYLHPQVEEITDTLPAGLGARLCARSSSSDSCTRPPTAASCSTRRPSPATRRWRCWPGCARCGRGHCGSSGSRNRSTRG
ncbi:hypothetical protein SALBM311S_11465 [Streptomyces alboniger]